MIANDHQKLADFIWSIANKLRGPYRPPQYRKVMLPLIVLRRLDCVLEATKDEVLKKYAALKNKGLSQTAIEKALAKTASKKRNQPLYNISRYTFQKLLGDPDGLAKNLTAYIKGFSPKVREIFEKFEFEAEIEILATPQDGTSFVHDLTPSPELRPQEFADPHLFVHKEKPAALASIASTSSRRAAHRRRHLHRTARQYGQIR
jgi:type I restriction enzyme M protein